MTWQLHDAKQRFSQLVAQARESGPQVVTRNGKEVVVVMSIETFREFSRPTPAEVLLGGPRSDDLADLLDEIVAERHSHEPRELDL